MRDVIQRPCALVTNANVLVNRAAIRAQILQHKDLVFLQLIDLFFSFFEPFKQFFELQFCLVDFQPDSSVGFLHVHDLLVQVVPVEDGWPIVAQFVEVSRW